MGRWEPDAVGRLRAAALDLFVERGYEGTTVADIAERAGLTARTFFRHYADKREVLFQGAELLQRAMSDAVRDAPAATPALGAIAAALHAAAAFFGDIRAFARRRRDVIAASAELRERELIKQASLSAALADALVARGVDAGDARLAAETATLVFRAAFAQWLEADETRGFGAIADELLQRLGALHRPPPGH
ncbi:bacterial regulatory protein, tetR family [mine drainage metagenome]|jgi:AcrR family transcriptional regulator|uniref:Bacterial regulatory protein, tetR family n=1 Tax=mine drainage metagenome TaxID=410659 RepID=A0A1J5PX13_9ZZZZ